MITVGTRLVAVVNAPQSIPVKVGGIVTVTAEHEAVYSVLTEDNRGWLVNKDSVWDLFKLEEAPAVVFDPLAYARYLVSTTGVSIAGLDLSQCTTKNEVNAIVFAQPTTQAALSAEQMEQLQELGRAAIEAEKHRAKDKIRQCIDRVQESHRYITLQLEEAAALRRLMDDIDEAGGVVKDITHLVSEGWYKLKELTSTCVKLTTPPISLTWRNPKAGVDKTVVLGEYTVEYYPERALLKVRRHADNIVTNAGYIHPHVSVDGGVCWGNAAEVYATSMTNMSPGAALTALRTLLQSYNDESPYDGFMSFYNKANGVVRQEDRYILAGDSGEHEYTTATIREDDLPDYVAREDVIRTYEWDTGDYDEDDTPITYDVKEIKLWVDTTDSAEEVYYYRNRDGLFKELTSDAVVEWE